MGAIELEAVMSFECVSLSFECGWDWKGQGGYDLLRCGLLSVVQHCYCLIWGVGGGQASDLWGFHSHVASKCWTWK